MEITWLNLFNAEGVADTEKEELLKSDHGWMSCYMKLFTEPHRGIYHTKIG